MPAVQAPGLLSTTEAAQKRLIDYQIAAQVKAQKELLAAQYDSSTAYANVVIGIGYVGFFAMWAFTRNLLTPGLVLWSALLMITSLFAFVGFEVYKMLRVSLSIRAMDRISFGDHDNFVNGMAKFNDAEQARSILSGRLWLVSFIVSAVFGFGAAGILLWAFVESLLWEYR